MLSTPNCGKAKVSFWPRRISSVGSVKPSALERSSGKPPLNLDATPKSTNTYVGLVEQSRLIGAP